MSMPGGRTTQVLVIMAPDSAGITPERQTMNSVNQPQQINRRVDRTMAIFLRAEPKTLGVSGVTNCCSAVRGNGGLWGKAREPEHTPDLSLFSLTNSFLGKDAKEWIPSH